MNSTKQEKKELLINAALELIFHSPNHNFTFQQLAQKTGMAPSNIYHYFKNKEDLMIKAYPYAYHNFVKELKDRLVASDLSHCSSKEKLIRLTMFHVLLLKEHPSYAYLFYFYKDKKAVDYVTESHSVHLQNFYRLLDDCIDETGCLRTQQERKILYHHWIVLCHGFVFSWLSGLIHLSENPEAFIENYLRETIYPLVFLTP